MQTSDPRFALADLSRQFGIDQRQDAMNSPQSAYESEAAALREGPVLPVVFLPQLYAISPRVRNWDAVQPPRSRAWHLENVWLAP